MRNIPGQKSTSKPVVLQRPTASVSNPIRLPSSSKSADANTAYRLSDLKPHPLAAIFPLASEKQRALLAEDIKARGLGQEILIFEGKILDGRNRADACIKANVEPRFQEYKDDDPVGEVISRNAHRRRMNASQSAMSAARLSSLELGANQYRSEGCSIEQAAKLLGVGISSVTRAKDVIKSGRQDLIDAVDAGRMSVSKAVSQLNPAHKVVTAPKPPTVKSLKEEIHRLGHELQEARRGAISLDLDSSPLSSEEESQVRALEHLLDEPSLRGALQAATERVLTRVFANVRASRQQSDSVGGAR